MRKGTFLHFTCNDVMSLNMNTMYGKDDDAHHKKSGFAYSHIGHT